MADRNPQAPRRWAEESEASGEPRLSELFQAVGDPQPLSAAALARVHDRLQSKRPTKQLSRRMRELVMAGSMLLLGASLALAGWAATEWVTERSQAAPQPAPETAAQKAAGALRGQRRPKAKEPGSPPPLEEVRPVPSSESSASVERNAAKAQAAANVDHRDAPPAAADSSRLAAEAEALERALLKLRREHDALGALAVLDESRALFAQGTLGLEAHVARVDALLALGRRAEALSLLEQLPLAQIGRSGELQLVRAELRAAGDCGWALRDFDALLTRALSAPLLERTLYGRAACELELGDPARAERDFNQYLARFPQGRFSDRVHSQLAEMRGKAQ